MIETKTITHTFVQITWIRRKCCVASSPRHLRFSVTEVLLIISSPVWLYYPSSSILSHRQHNHTQKIYVFWVLVTARFFKLYTIFSINMALRVVADLFLAVAVFEIIIIFVTGTVLILCVRIGDWNLEPPWASAALAVCQLSVRIVILSTCHSIQPLHMAAFMSRYLQRGHISLVSRNAAPFHNRILISSFTPDFTVCASSDGSIGRLSSARTTS